MKSTYFIGRIGKDAEVRTTPSGKKFVTMDIAFDDSYGKEPKTRWIRVRSWRENHQKLAQYLTKGKLVNIIGQDMEPTIWTDKQGQNHIQEAVLADTINFVSIGRKGAGKTNSAAPVAAVDTADVPAQVPPAPEDKGDDLPF